MAGIERSRQDQINVKHIVGDLSEIDIGMAIVVGLNTRRYHACLLYTSPSPRDRQKSRMPSSA